MFTLAETKQYIQDRTSDYSPKKATQIESLIAIKNEYLRKQLTANFNRDFASIKSEAGESKYSLPYGFETMLHCYAVIDGTRYDIRPVYDRQRFSGLQSGLNTNNESEYPIYYLITNNDIEFYPTLSTDDVDIYFDFITTDRRLLASDFIDKTAGTIAINTDDTTVTGTTTAFAATDVGRYILIGREWFRVISYTSATEIEIDRPYTGPNLTGATYVLGSSLDLPLEVSELLAMHVAMEIFMDREDRPQVNVYRERINDQLKLVRRRLVNKDTSPHVNDLPDWWGPQNPNNFPVNLTN